MAEDIGDKIAALRAKVGPKRMKTPQVEVEQHDLAELARLADRTGVRAPTLSSMGWCIAQPKYNSCGCGEQIDPSTNSGYVE